MAPAGSYESLQAAIQAGADAVYFGASRLNMRTQSSANFTPDDIRNIVTICHQHNVKAYLTLNSVLFDEDLDEMRTMVDTAASCGVDAVIVSDQSAIMYARSKGVRVHISTQLSISNYESVKFYAPFAEVMVLARELNLKQMKTICQSIERDGLTGASGEPVRIEVFCHGALCVATSGKCYMSLHTYNKSANRGQCLQNCRRSYVVTDKETGEELEIENERILSPKDLNTLPFIDKLLDTGVTVLKIEGRARAPEYVKTVVECYNEAINAVCNGTFSQEKIDQWNTRLATVFNRGFWGGYYLGRTLGEWSESYGSQATKVKVYVGKATNFFSKLGVAEFLVESNELNAGDEILIIGPTTGVIEQIVDEIRVDLQPVDKTVKGELFSIKTQAMVRRNDKLYKLIEN